MGQTDLLGRIADTQLHGAGYKTLMCFPENALTGASAQLEALVAVPFAHVLRRAFVMYTSTDSANSDQCRLFKAIVGGTFATIGLNLLSIGGLTANIIEFGVTSGEFPQEEESSDTGALYRAELDLVIGTDIVNDFGLAVMVSPIPHGGYQHAQ